MKLTEFWGVRESPCGGGGVLLDCAGAARSVDTASQLIVAHKVTQVTAGPSWSADEDAAGNRRETRSRSEKALWDMDLRDLSTDVKNFGAALEDDPSDSVGVDVLEEGTAPVTFENDPQTDAGREGQELWQVILEHVKNQVNPQSFSTWFEPSRLATVREGELVVEGPNQ